MRNYLRFAAEVAVTVLAALVPLIRDGWRLDPQEWLNVAIVGLGAVSVLGAGDLPSGVWRWTKPAVAALTAALVAAASYWTGGFTPDEWVQIGLAAVGVLGGAALPGPKVLPVDAAAGVGGAT